MKGSIERAVNRAILTMDIASNIVSKVTGVSPEELKSNACAHKITGARFLFVELCGGIVSPTYMIADYLGKNRTMISYYRNSFSDLYNTDCKFREMSDKADALLTELLTNVNGTIGNVFQG